MDALSPSNIRRLSALVFALLLGYFFIVVEAQLAWKNYWLVKDGQQGIAVVTKVLWTGHNGVAYRYRVNQVEYTGSDGRNWQDPKYAHVMVGEQSVVYFSSSHPWLSGLNRPRSMMIEGLPVLLLVWGLEALLVLTVIDPNHKWALRFSYDSAKSQTKTQAGSAGANLR